MIDAWESMLRSVERRRDVDARFYKPTCLLAVIDGIADSSLAPADLDPDRVIARFRDYLLPIFPERANFGWRPFWHLSRDGAWAFSKEGRLVRPDDFGPERKPNSRRALMTRIDRVEVPTEQRSSWRSATARAELRARVITMLRHDDLACRRVADHLDRDGTFFSDPHAASRGADIVTSAGSGGASARQGFHQSPEARRAIENRAMEVAKALLEAQGWQLEDVSARRSYDLHGTRGEATCFVEVKGTAGPGDEIRITAAEVAFANLNRDRMRLIVVTAITLAATSDGVIASGGTPHMLKAWAPEPGDLTAVSYYCRVALPS